MLAARFHVETRYVHMAKNIPMTSPGPVPPGAARTLLALLHAQGEVARLSEREQLFSSLLESVNAVLWAFDWETREVLYVSPAYERIFGRPASLVLADFNEWRDSIYPDDLEYAERSLADVLTQSSNRRHFFESAYREFEQARLQGLSLSFLLLDIDDFKQVNDRYGHPEGDQVLQRIAESGRAVLRRGDLFGRIGGEEFAAVFPGCPPQVAQQIAERLQREIQRLSFTHDGQAYGVTVSQGLTNMTEADESLDNLFARADEAMYQAKRQGKNQIVLA